MSILIVRDDDGPTVPNEAQIFEPFVRDLALKHGNIAELTCVPIEDGVWGYCVSGDAPLMIRCHAKAEPVDQNTVLAFFGEFTIARKSEERMVAILLSTGGFTAERSNSARAFHENIRKLPEGDGFHLYDSYEMIDVASGLRKLTSARELVTRVEQAVGDPPATYDLVLAAKDRYWLVELGGAAKGAYLILESSGELATPDAVERRISSLIKPRPQLVSVDCVANQRYAMKFRARPQNVLGQSPGATSLIALVESDRRLRQQTEALARSARDLLCHERGESLCQAYERAMLTFFDHIAPLEIAVPQNEPAQSGSISQAAAAITTAIRIAALYLASVWAHRTDRKSLGDPGAFAQRLVASASFSAEWLSLLPSHVGAAVVGVTSLVSDHREATRTRWEELAGLAGHLAAALGPFCGIYRTALHQHLLPDEMPDSLNAPHLEAVWTDHTVQQLKALVNVPTPRTHRHVVANRALVQLAIERVEDSLGRMGEVLPFTRLNVSTNNSNFEQIECYFELESEHILKIFMGEELYSSKDVWVRELLQNAIDATLLRKVLVDEEGYRPEVVVVHDSKKAEVQVADNGIGMSLYHIRKFFSKVGRSYYRSTELEDELRKQSRSFNPISRFGVGFLSVFMVSKSAEILTSHVSKEGQQEGLSIFIPALMEDFFLRRNEPVGAGTKIILELLKDLDESIEQLVRRYILRPTVDIKILAAGNKTVVLPATNHLSIVPTIVNSSRWSASFIMISARAEGDGYSALIGVLIPRHGAGASDRKYDSQWSDLPKTRLALAQAGIWVKDDNDLFGERRGRGEAYHPYFKRLYGIVDFQPGTLKMNVSRNDFVLDEAANSSLKGELLDKTIGALIEAIDAETRKIGNSREKNEYLRAVLLGAIEDGEELYWSRNRSAAQLRYSNSDSLTAAMAGLFARHFLLEQRALNQSEELTVKEVLRAWAPGQELYYTYVSDIDHDPLFKAWLTEQPSGTRVFFTRNRREASLLIEAFQASGYPHEVKEVARKQLQMAIHFNVTSSMLDKHILGCAGVVEFGQYKPTTAILVMPTSSQHTVSKAIGLVSMRAECSERPFVLLDAKHWLPQFLVSAADLADEHEDIKNYLREVCQILVINVALGDTVAIRREGLQALNNRLTRLYACIESVGKAGDIAAIERRSMVTMAELVGNRR